MKPLFENKTTLSKDMYIELLSFQQKKFGWKYTVFTVIFFLLFVLLIAILLANHYFVHSLLIFIIFACFLAYELIIPVHKNTKELRSDKVQNNLANTFSFYDKYFIVENRMGNDKIFYFKLYRVFETENYFYLYLNKTTILVLSKTEFLIGTVQDFGKFIKQKMWLKFKRF